MMNVTGRVVQWSTALAVLSVASVAAETSYEHCLPPGAAHSEAGWTARLVPVTVDGLIYASSMVMLDYVRRTTPVPPLARWLLGLSIAATLAANVVHGLGHGLVGAGVAASVAAALVGSYELLMMVIPRFPGSAGRCVQDRARGGSAAGRAAELFAGQLAKDWVPSVRAIRAQLHVGQPRAQRLRDHLATGAARQAQGPQFK
jgi:hypothetical protein